MEKANLNSYDREVLKQRLVSARNSIENNRRLLDEFVFSMVKARSSSEVSKKIAKRYGFETVDGFLKSRNVPFDSPINKRSHTISQLNPGYKYYKNPYEKDDGRGNLPNDYGDVIPCSFIDSASRHR